MAVTIKKTQKHKNPSAGSGQTKKQSSSKLRTSKNNPSARSGRAIKRKSGKEGKKNNKVKTKLPARLVAYLGKAGVKHNILEHKTVYTAYDAAQTLKKKLDEIAKSLLIMADRNYYLIILRADQNLDFKKLQILLSKQDNKPVKVIKIPGEKVMETVFKVRAGALGAFGQLHKLPVVVDKELAKAKKAVFSSGSFNHSVEMGVKDFVKLENALLGAFGVKKNVKLQNTAKVKNVRMVKKVQSKKIKK
jgi:Ala-tRNA(Pro) deacylase